MQGMTENSVLIVDFHPLVRYSLRTLLEKEGYRIVGEASEGSEAIEMTRKLRPDVITLELNIPKIDGLSVISHLKASGMDTKILVVTSRESTHYITRSLRNGAMGFVSKKECVTEIPLAIRMLLAGRTFFPADITSVDIHERERVNPLSRLSDREVEVLHYLVQGWTNKKISETLCLCDKTVSTYKTRMMKKLNANTFVDLIELAKKYQDEQCS